MVLEKKLPESKKLLKNFVMGQNLQKNVTILNRSFDEILYMQFFRINVTWLPCGKRVFAYSHQYKADYINPSNL